jgi:Ca2+-binding EF-hand superfamily protein
MPQDIDKIMDSFFVGKVKDDATIRAFKTFFADDNGKIVLETMLGRLKFLEHCNNEQDMALNNFAKDLLLTIYWNEETQSADTGRIMDYVRKFIKGLRSKR